MTTVEPMLRRLLGERIELVIRTEPDSWLTVADRSQLEAILVNLAVNASDAMPNGGTLTIETANVELDERYGFRHTEVTPGQYAMVTVTDTGIGMDDATLAHIFEPFFTTKSAGTGTGLGLATVYGTVRQSGGYVWVYSEPGHGTTFKIYLPRTTQERDADLEPSTPASTTKPQHATILVAEDEAVVREMVVASLERLGYRVMAAGTGEEAVRLIDRLGDEIDLLLSDVVMPGMSGPDLLDRARRTKPELRADLHVGVHRVDDRAPDPAGRHPAREALLGRAAGRGRPRHALRRLRRVRKAGSSARPAARTTAGITFRDGRGAGPNRRSDVQRRCGGGRITHVWTPASRSWGPTAS